jgi:hypothetical protein
MKEKLLLIKPKLVLIFKIGLTIGCVLLALYLIGFGHNLVGVWQVEKITLKASNGNGTSTVQLKEDDVRQFIRYYNRSRCVGDITAEGCNLLFFVQIHLKDGNIISLSDHHEERMNVSGTAFESYWADNETLVEFIYALIEDYGLQLKTWSVC